MTFTVAVVGTTPEEINSNSHIRNHLTEGFRELGPDWDVWALSPEQFWRWDSLPSKLICIFVGSVLELRFDVEALIDKARRNHARTGVWLHDDPYEFDASRRVLQYADVVFTNDRASLYHYPEAKTAIHLPLAASSDYLDSPVSRDGDDFLFSGVPFPNRQQFFRQFRKILNDRCLRLRGSIIGPSWDLANYPDAIDLRIGHSSLMKRYKSSKSTIYLGRDFDLLNNRYSIRPSTPGPRLFECAGAGGCQVVLTPGLEVMEYLTVDEEMLFVDSVEEAVDQVYDLSRDPQRSLKIGRQAQRRVKSEHLYYHRAEKILAVMNSI